MQYIAVILAAIVMIAFLMNHHPIRLELDHRGVRRARNLPNHLWTTVESFARENLKEGECIVIAGDKRSDGSIRWIFPKDCEKGLDQRLRNYIAVDSGN